MARGSAGRKPAAPRVQPDEVEPAEGPSDAVTGGASFGLCEGTRLEIEQHGKAVDPFTGKTVTRADVK